jgi:pathogenesis-related protein 1
LHQITCRSLLRFSINDSMKSKTPYRTLCYSLALFLVICSSCGQFGQPQDGVKDTSTPKPKSPKQPFKGVGKLGEICASIVNEKPAGGPLTTVGELKARFTASHNDIRKRYGLAPLVWDDQIAAYAQKWANHLKAHNRCLMQHRKNAGILDGRNYGENLAWNWISTPVPAGFYTKSPEWAVLGWSEECKDYHYEDASCTPNEQCGHFTQVVWQDSAKFGCGMALCDNTQNSKGKGRAEVWVCNYDPPGNVIMNDQQGNKTILKPF